MRAEGEAQAAARKLAVAQEQFGEVLIQRAADVASLARRAEQLEALLARALGQPGADADVAGGPPGVLLHALPWSPS